MSTKKVLQHVDKNMNVLVKDLRGLIQQPSVSAKKFPEIAKNNKNNPSIIPID